MCFHKARAIISLLGTGSAFRYTPSSALKRLGERALRRELPLNVGNKLCDVWKARRMNQVKRLSNAYRESHFRCVLGGVTAFLDLFKGDQKAARGAVETFCERFKVAPDHKKTLFTNCEDEDWRHALADALSDGDHMGLSELEELFTNRSPGLSSPVGLAKLLCLSVKRPAFDALSIFKVGSQALDLIDLSRPS